MPDNVENRTAAPKVAKKNKNNMKKKIIFFLIKHSILAGCAFFLAFLMFLMTMDKVVMPFYQGSGREIDAPYITGKTVAQAERILKEKKVFIRVEKREFNNSYSKDTIYLQIPSPGTKIKRGRNIRVFISRGPRPIRIPDVVGMSQRNARLAIQEKGLYVKEGSWWIPSNDYPSGLVARQEPEGGQDVPDDTVVILYISNGKKETNVIMPGLLNLSLSAAKDTLRTRNFNLARLKVQKEEQPDLLPDTVIDQYPEPGFPAHTNDEVVLIISK